MPKVIVSGLTAAGKTTHSKLIADFLDVPYFSGSGLLSELAGIPGPWRPEVDLVRTEGALDRALDTLMISRLDTSQDGVFDAWTLPWLTTSPVIKVWIQSDLPSRVRKAMVTELRRGELPVQEAVQGMVYEKDEFSRTLFNKLYDFDLFNDHWVFDLVIDNSSYISAATIEDSDKGIASFNEALLAKLKQYL